MNTKYILPACALALTALTFSSCEESFNTQYYGNSQSEEQVQQTTIAKPERINAAVAGMYGALKNPYGFFGVTSGRADDCGYITCAISQDLNSADMTNIVSGYDWFSPAHEWSDRNADYANPRLRYGLFYKIIYATKEVLAAIPEDTDDPEFIAKRGQAKALRAFSYLSIAPYFQFNYADHKAEPSVPVVLPETDSRNNPRVSLEELYTQHILPDLNDAIADLEGFQRENKGVIDQNVVYGLRARANLYMENWQAAADDAEKALAGYRPYTLQEIADNPRFCEASDEPWIWGLLLPLDIVGTSLATWPSQLSSFSGNSYVAFSGIYRQINVLLWNKISTTDVRRAWWLDENLYSPYLEADFMVWDDVANSKTYKGKDIPAAKISDVKEPMPAYTNFKFVPKAGIGSAENAGDWCMMRAEEMLLIRAEGLLKAGKEGEAKTVLESLMAQRDPQYKQTCKTLADEIWLQRRIELWGEGFAMADVMRLKKNVVRFHPGVATNVPAPYQFNIEYGNPWMLMRFVTDELTNNPAVEQNTGGQVPAQGDGAALTDGVTD